MKKETKKSKRLEITKDCIKYDIMPAFVAYKQKIQNGKHANPKIHHLAWYVYSDYLLLSKRTPNTDICECITCGAKKHRNDPQMQPWHYRRQGWCLKYKFVDDNVRPQCYKCNCILWGEYRNYKIFIEKKFGVEWEDKIRTDQQSITIRWYEYAEMIQKRWEYSSQEVLKLSEL